MTNHREALLMEALGYVNKDRNSAYDAPERNFERIAQIMAAMGYGHDTRGPMKAEDVAILMMAVKLARLGHNPAHRDSAVDMAGYAACQADVVASSETQKGQCNCPGCTAERKNREEAQAKKEEEIERLAEYANTHQPNPGEIGAGQFPGESPFPRTIRTMPVTVPESLLTPDIDAEAKLLKTLDDTDAKRTVVE